MPIENPTTTIQIVRRFDAPSERVFDAWLDPELAGKWLFATPGGEMLSVEIDPRVGGGFTIIERRGDEDVAHYGRYLELDRPRRLTFDFGDEIVEKATIVTVDIASIGAGCELTLTHEGVYLEFADRTKDGWTTLLAGLAQVLSETA
ncbi:MAG: SRPBCC domain-containing protein [Capsulimonas sp.]|uniref:SRPBCC family protein n=1 Tax=Capsulimonas sp. TaxID=2494211 RepID=UPI00326396D9